MANYYGAIGYAELIDEGYGDWKEQIVERNYYGKIIRQVRLLQSGDQINDDINVSNVISVISDSYATQNINAIRYLTFMGSKWKVARVEVKFPRLELTIGGVYNGQEE